ncbi:hypothetical protein SYNTR_2100 [Candidatus Syntrophocurvum alkaliphilum]|uniref:SPOR domain-containing protein n=1 Tax=Candidatus Syntrophocurvum alkaliphilum TaxID=2293317 RepID=A0A6I6DIK7_9FIRM|nr:hypothetical protein [Candidatus Syntrophocurvum alkaliphilum]QGU00694.1 hypothetical protein SYNTR_2100 [Candidatus Syntrophocurvum alkaliphilum]
MQLNIGERSLLAYFTTYSDASKAIDELKQQGYTDIQINNISNHPDVNTYYNLENLSSATSYSTYQNKSLMGSHLSSSMAGNNSGGSYSYLLTVITDKNKALDAFKILKRNNASV